MNVSSVIGILLAGILFFWAALTSTPAWKVFFNVHSIVIVVGGTVAAGLICYKFTFFLGLVKVVFKKIIGKDSQKFEIIINEIVELAKNYREKSTYLKDNVERIKSPFLKEAIVLVVQGGMSPDAIDDILILRSETHYKRHEDDANTFKTIGKFPPAFGLMGTTLSMIGLMQGMGGQDAYKTLGPSMAIGLVATLYGIAISNLILIPMGENLSKLNKEDEVLREIVREGIKLLRRKEHPIVVEEHLLSFLLPSERISIMKKVS